MSSVRHDLPEILGHELRNPLASALASATLARGGVADGDPSAIVLDGVLKDLDRMIGLLDGWMAIASDQKGTQDRVDIEELLSRVASSQQVEVICVPPAFAVQSNVVLLERAIESLCENARAAAAKHIRIAAQHDGSHVDIHVEDDGCAVDAADVERIFEAGYSRANGAGIGLHVVATMVAACAGKVRCVPLPDGARFTISLPRAEHTLA